MTGTPMTRFYIDTAFSSKGTWIIRDRKDDNAEIARFSDHDNAIKLLLILSGVNK